MGFNIDVKQGEMLIVMDKDSSKNVISLNTVGLAPCVGLVIWHAEFCALAHFEDVPQPDYLNIILNKFKSSGKHKLVKCKIVAGFSSAHDKESEKKIKALSEICEKNGIEDEIHRERKDAAKVMVHIETGEISYTFEGKSHQNKEQRIPSEDWTTRPQTMQKGYLSIGVIKASRDTIKIYYIKSNNVDEIKEAYSA